MSADRSYLVVAGVVGEFGQAEFFQQWRQVHAEPPAVAVAQSVPAADWIVRRPSPRLDRAIGRRFLLIRRAEGNPAVLLRKPRGEVLDRPQVVSEGRGANLAHQRRRAGLQVFVD